MASAYDESIQTTIKNNLPLVGAIAGVLIFIIGLVFGLGFYFNGNNNDGYVYQEGLKRDYNIVQGGDDLKLRFVYYLDYQCPVCAANAQTMITIKEKYKDQVQFVYKQYPISELHPQANRAAYAIQAAEKQGKGMEYGTILLQKQDARFENDTLTQYARDLNLDVEKWDAFRKSEEVKQEIKWDIKDLDETAAPESTSGRETKPKGKGSGTPTAFIIKDNKVVDWIPGRLEADGYSQVIDKHLAD